MSSTQNTDLRVVRVVHGCKDLQAVSFAVELGGALLGYTTVRMFQGFVRWVDLGNRLELNTGVFAPVHVSTNRLIDDLFTLKSSGGSLELRSNLKNTKGLTTLMALLSLNDFSRTVEDLTADRPEMVAFYQAACAEFSDPQLAIRALIGRAGFAHMKNTNVAPTGSAVSRFVPAPDPINEPTWGAWS